MNGDYLEKLSLRLKHIISKMSFLRILILFDKMIPKWK